MKTILDTLNLPDFRQRPQLFLGSKDVKTLQIWMYGYMDACDDADEQERLYTPNGLPILLLRDFIALREGVSSTASLAGVLLEAVHGNEEKAWARFFEHLDAFQLLEIKEVRHMVLTDEMIAFAAKQNRLFEIIDGKKVPYDFRQMSPMRKILMNNGLAWIEQGKDRAFWICNHGDVFKSEKDADREIKRLFGRVQWDLEPENI